VLTKRMGGIKRLVVRPCRGITMRIIMGILSLGCAAGIGFHIIALFSSVTLPTIRQLGQEQSVFYILKVGPLSFSGWQILAFELALGVLMIGFAALGMYLFGSRANAA
jgi:hypothetical protein